MKLKIEDLKAKCNPENLEFKTTEEIEALEQGIIGQERAVNAIDLGLRLKQEGYNIFICGSTGTGKTTYAKTIAKKKSEKKEVPDDLAYVYNFKEKSKPNVLILPSGLGEEFKKDMKSVIEELEEEIPKALESEEHENKKSSLMTELQEESNKYIEDLENEIREEGFILQHSAQGTMPKPIPINKEGNPISKEEFQEMAEEDRKRIKEKNLEIQEKIDKLRRMIRNLKLETQEELDKLDKKIGLSIINPIFDNLKGKYKCCDDVISYFQDVKQNLIENIEKFAEKNTQNNFLMALQQGKDESFLNRYQVNLFVNNKNTKGAPVIVESNPTYYNLFGKIEGKSQFGAITTDFTMIKSGAIHRANGGYLILNARDVLQKPFAWETLKRTLLNQETIIENIGEQYRAIPTTTLKPKAIPINLKIILIGNPWIYQLLYYYDEEFKKLFKIKADFDIEMKRDKENLNKFSSFIASVIKRENIKHFTAEAIAKVIDYSSRITDKKEKLSTKFNEILEILFEANAWSEMNDNKFVEAEDVLKAIKEKYMRANLIEEKIQEMINKGHILIDVEGEEIGQINALSVYRTGEYSFGRPSRVTARTYLGQEGVINIEREAKMSGNIHNKAVMILSAYLGGKYAQDKPLSLSASLAFEQNYVGIDGDSASCAELIALLSSISKIPVKQTLAITGSMNQKGKVQPIGGVNEKIEGYFKVCKELGLNSNQGVVIPLQNMDNLMLEDEVLEAVAKGEFNIYAVKDIDEAIELMMGENLAIVHKKVQESLIDFADKTADFNDSSDDSGDNDVI
ncbi:Lon protease family protein [Natronospora cellulosivora (SeqCode)]